jgi:hypothetical protein
VLDHRQQMRCVGMGHVTSRPPTKPSALQRRTHGRSAVVFAPGNRLPRRQNWMGNTCQCVELPYPTNSGKNLLNLSQLDGGNERARRTMHFSDDDFTPVSDTLLFRLYHANRSGLPLPIAEIPLHLRPTVALYCYRRGHLEETAIRIAATCDEEDLVFAGGRVGSVLFSKSRLPYSNRPSGQLMPKSKITLAVPQGTATVYFDQDVSDEIN